MEYRMIKFYLLSKKIIHVISILSLTIGMTQTSEGASVTLSWKPNQESDLAEYRIYRRVLPSSDYGAPIFSGTPRDPQAPSHTITGLLDGTTYGFIATALDQAGNESGPSNEVTTTTTGTPPPPPPPP
ncbi:MAG: fibronectin type III domain-containing protein, partial [Nitrospira sp.]|nr:fibronectin type III domain-containing protein [Nitrospira sp.]